MIRVFLYGDDWVGHLAALLNERSQGQFVAEACEYPAISPLRIFRAAWRADVLMRVGVRPGAPGKRLFLLDLFWLILVLLSPRKHLIFYWIGTDVLDAVKQPEVTQSLRSITLLRLASHFSNAPWLKEELAAIGIESRMVLFPVGKVSPPAIAEIKWSAPFLVLSYVPDQRHRFYGGDTLLAVARRLPGIQFKIVGGSGSWASEIPGNVEFLGFVDHMDVLLNSAHVVVRQVEHDAIGGTVREGLFYARHVLYSYKLPHTSFVAWGDEEGLHAELVTQHERYLAGQWAPNWEGRRYAVSHWSPEALLGTFMGALRAEVTSAKSFKGR